MPSLNSSIIETLLYEDEGPSLDFKREQYEFDKADNATKSELLKDVLAFANSWRRTTAYILIGVIEKKGGRCEVVGISKDLDDAKLQQFVNAKTQRPVVFSYRTFIIGSVPIGVIEIPVQERPVYLTSSYGKLEKEKVYIRRGSSTATASPDEIIKMGVFGLENTPPKLVLEWADLEKHRVLASPCILETVFLDPQLPENTFENRGAASAGFLSRTYDNRNYSKEVIEFTFLTKFYRRLGFLLHNEGETVAKRVRFVGSVANETQVMISDWEDRPVRPHRNSLLGIHSLVKPLAEQFRKSPDPCVRKFEKFWEITIDFGDVRPHDEIWTTSPILVGATRRGAILLEGELRGDNLPKPIPCALSSVSEVVKKGMEYSDVKECMSNEDDE